MMSKKVSRNRDCSSEHALDMGATPHKGEPTETGFNIFVVVS